MILVAVLVVSVLAGAVAGISGFGPSASDARCRRWCAARTFWGVRLLGRMPESLFWIPLSLILGLRVYMAARGWRMRV